MYKKIIPLSLTVATVLSASEIELPKISVESTVISEVSQKAQLSADLAQALSSSVPSIDMSRRSGIANDIFIRGQKRDNISVDVDGTKIFGACPNRMDPPTSHIVTSQIENVEVIEGPYDVENFGTLSGGLRITTKEPTKELQGEINLGAGSYGYEKIGGTISGGNDFMRVLIAGTNESSDQYKDGNKNTLAEQIDKAVLEGSAPNAFAYQPKYHDMEAYEKKSLMTKAYFTIVEDQELRLSMTTNRTDDVLYSNSKMDAAYDDSNIYSVAYDIKNINDVYKNINLKYYYSDVDHPMDTKYRKIADNNGWYRTNHLETSMQGLKLKNDFDINGYNLLVGLDGSKRTWEGKFYNTDVATGAVIPGSTTTSLTDTETKNMAIFAKVEKAFDDLNIEVGARFDDTEIEPTDTTKRARDYDALSANILTTYSLDEANKFFLGVGQANRVPDPRELYYSDGLGNDNLNQTTNTEIDLGYELNNNVMSFKIKTFYSMLKDYIYYNKPSGTFNNIDATVYGAEAGASIYFTDALTLDMGVSYKIGEKDDVVAGESKNLADIAPLRGDVALNYEYMKNSTATIQVQASDKWEDYDIDSGEQEIDSWAILNLKVKHAINKNFDVTVGVNNLFNEAYALSNTHADLTLLGAGGDTMLLNEPGRYIYTNFTFKF